MDLCLSCWKENRRIEVRAEGAAFVLGVFDHCTIECIGLYAAKRGARFEALEQIRQGIRERFGGDGAARGFRLRLQLPR